MSYPSSSNTRGRQRRPTRTTGPRTESLEARRLLAAEIGVSSAFGPAISDGDNTPSESDGTDFGTAFVGNQRPFRTYQVTNTSPTDDLQLSGVTVPAGFKLEQNLPDLLGPGSSGFFTISLLDTEQTTRSGVVQFATNVPGKETFNFNVTGTLAPAEVPQDNDFEDVPSLHGHGRRRSARKGPTTTASRSKRSRTGCCGSTSPRARRARTSRSTRRARAPAARATPSCSCCATRTATPCSTSTSWPPRSRRSPPPAKTCRWRRASRSPPGVTSG